MSDQFDGSSVIVDASEPSSTSSLKPTGRAPESFTVVKRNGSLVPFRRDRIQRALDAAFRDTKKVLLEDPYYSELQKLVNKVTDQVVDHLTDLAAKGACLTVEGIQDMVEVTLMKAGYHDVARDYIVYRSERKKIRSGAPENLKIMRKDGSLVRFNPMKVASSIEESFRRVQQIHGSSPDELVDAVRRMTDSVVEQALELAKEGTTLHAATIQDAIEHTLMREGFFEVAKDCILHHSRLVEEHGLPIVEKQPAAALSTGRSVTITLEGGEKRTLSESQLFSQIQFACRGLTQTDPALLLEMTFNNFYEGMKASEVDLSAIMAARSMIEREPCYSQVAARLLLDVTYREAMGISANDPNLDQHYRNYFKSYLDHGIAIERLSPELKSFDLDRITSALVIERDDLLQYLGIQNLHDRYFIHDNERRIETPQIFWMRVAMGVALKEEKKEERAIEFYELLSTFHFTSATPTLFNAGTTHSQLSSCYLSTVMDDLGHIFKLIADNAQLSKWAGGIGNDWTNVRAAGSWIKGTNGKSQGVIPFLKVANDTAVAVNQGGKRKGVACCYLETWHLDIEDFLELRKNTGDERRRTHDMNTANWIPDLFMKRVKEGGHWTLFSPCDTPDLHHIYGSEFEKRYTEYERMAESGELKLHKRVEALTLWRKMLSMLFETGHPWITFKDPSNIRSPQDHMGVVHSSNLCTEILLNSSAEETAVCNLGSINLGLHIRDGKLNEERLAKTIRTAIRMLDNVIDNNFYPTVEARTANLRHRPIGMGLMGFQDALYLLDISYASHEAVEFADRSMEMISYYAILASSELAQERGPYPSYKGSKWDRGWLPIDTIGLLERERGLTIEMDRSSRMDWSLVRESIRRHGMRNSNTMAIAPTATISNIIGTTQSVEPMYKHLFVKSNLSGDFTIPNVYLVEKLRSLGLWDNEMLDDLKYFDGVISEIDRIPDEVKRIYLTAFEIEPEWIIECASRRQKWIDMGQSLNLYLSQPSGKKMHDMYMLAWNKGLKTTYYLRTLAATQIEKSTTDINKRGLQPRWMKNQSASSSIRVEREETSEPDFSSAPKSCSLDGDCESCQ